MRKNVFPAGAVLLVLGVLGLTAQTDALFQKARLAPLSPEYLRYQEAVRTGRWPAFTDQGQPSPIPSPIDVAYLQGFSPAPATALPSTYDLRKLNKTTPVKNQSPLAGTSLFATFGSLESYLKPLESLDFSENHLDQSSAGGGFLEANVGALARWDDPVDEEDSPWSGSVNGEGGSVVKHVQNVLFISPRENALDNAGIKQAVMDYGAIYSEMYFASAAYNSPNRSFYNEGTAQNSHSVAIAGWDDNFDRAKFSPQPPGNGAFICKNSFGPGWAEAGYFYVSYYDAYLGRRALSAAFTAEPAAGLTQNYQHDPNGCLARMGFGEETAWFANIFTATSPDPLKAVSLYLYAAAGSYEILVYKDIVPGRPRSGTLAQRVSGTLSAPGYHTIALSSPIPLAINQRFSVAVKFRTPGDSFPIPIEHPLPGLKAVFTARPGESFISPDGAIWSDLVTYDGSAYARSNVCLKAFAGYPVIYSPLNLRVERLVNNFAFFKEYVDRLNWLPNPLNADDSLPVVKYRIYRKPISAPDESFELAGESGAQNLVFYVRNLKRDDRNTYRVTAVLENGRESDPAEISNL